MIRTILYSLWLPLLVVGVSVARFGFQFISSGPDLNQFLILFALTWPAAVPLTLAVRLIHRRSPVLAIVCALVLGPIALAGAIMGGLLGPVGVVGYPVATSIPAWILLGILALTQRGRRSQAFGR
jgi:hypothetical protein